MISSRALQAIRVLLVMPAIALASCTSSTPDPEPSPRYEQISRDLCERSRTSEVAKKFDLRVDKQPNPGGRYLEINAYWQLVCSFYGIAEEGRFLSAAGTFTPQAGVDIRVHKDFSSAERGFASQAELLQTRSNTEGQDVTATARAGWWDESLARISRKDPEPRLAQRPDAISLIDIRYVIRHHNLIVISSIFAASPTSEADEAMTFLDDLLNALMEEHVSHLVRSG